MRKAYVKKKVNRPASKPRHEKIDFALFTRTEDKSFLKFRNDPLRNLGLRAAYLFEVF